MQIVPNYPGRGNFRFRGLSWTSPGPCGVNNFSSLSFHPGIQARSSRTSPKASTSRAMFFTTMTTLFTAMAPLFTTMTALTINPTIPSRLFHRNRSPHMPATRAIPPVRPHSRHLLSSLLIFEGGILAALALVINRSFFGDVPGINNSMVDLHYNSAAAAGDLAAYVGTGGAVCAEGTLICCLTLGCDGQVSVW